MTEAKADEAAVHVKHWLTQHPGRAAAARFPIDELWTLLDERAERLELAERIAADCARRAGYYDHPEIWLPGSQSPDAVGARAMQQAWSTAARLIRSGEIPAELILAGSSDIETGDGGPDVRDAAIAAGGIGSYRCPTSCDSDCEVRCHEGHQVGYKQTHDVDECRARDAAAEAYRRVLASGAEAAARARGGVE